MILSIVDNFLLIVQYNMTSNVFPSKTYNATILTFYFYTFVLRHFFSESGYLDLKFERRVVQFNKTSHRLMSTRLTATLYS